MNLRDFRSKADENKNIPQLLPQRKDSVVPPRGSRSKVLARDLGSLIPLVPHLLSAIQSSWFLDCMQSILHRLDNLETMAVCNRIRPGAQHSHNPYSSDLRGGSLGLALVMRPILLIMFGVSENLTLEGKVECPTKMARIDKQ